MHDTMIRIMKCSRCGELFLEVLGVILGKIYVLEFFFFPPSVCLFVHLSGIVDVAPKKGVNKNNDLR